MEEEKIMGCLGIGEQETDYTLCAGFDDKLPTLYKQDEVRYFYNQYIWNWSTVSCTIFAAAGMLSDLKNYKFSEAELKEMDELSYTRGRVRGQGWYVQSAVKCVADWWNENKKLTDKYGKVAYYRLSKYDDDEIDSVLAKNYTLDTSYQGSKKYGEDKKDGVLDGTDFGPATYGHSVDIINYNGKRSVKDTGSTNQIYELKHKLSEIKCYGNFLYLYTNVEQDALERVKKLNEIRTKIVNGMDINSELWHLSGSDLHKDKLHNMNDFFRDWLSYIDSELKTLI